MGVLAIPAAVQRNALSELSSREHSPYRRRQALAAREGKSSRGKKQSTLTNSAALEVVRIEFFCAKNFRLKMSHARSRPFFSLHQQPGAGKNIGDINQCA
jgi:hypothetical protein